MDKLNLKIRVADIKDVELILSLIGQKAEFDGCLDALEATADKLRQTLFYSGLHPHEVHLRLCSGSINAAAIQTKPKGFPSLAGNPLYYHPPQAHVLLAEVEGIPVGFALYHYTYSSFLAQQGIWLDDLFVQSHMRGKGIGQALIDSLAQIAAENNCGRIEWTVNKDNAPAIAFYKKQGARIMESIRLCRIDRIGISRLAGKELAITP
ncbi:GNAT family N-acetyltransferase [Microseira wollei]|uniref:GCN5-related N-acetyltransferase n=1 Tax=Microseira wollei NIES-4236 TaxID=2530354 RepID=A0AAV3XNM2_9CYAN|nr:GNAT family N-acetyltransferase [Microseira wollei]GET41172.1 GCN5-related N-acetyltransferase [Microseira wollei NIES-4236]